MLAGALGAALVAAGALGSVGGQSGGSTSKPTAIHSATASCQYGTDAYGGCLPPPVCQYGTDAYGGCLPPPPPPVCQYGTNPYGVCNPPPPPPVCQYGVNPYGGCNPPPLPGAPTFTHNEVNSGHLVVAVSGGGTITISCPSGNVLVNGSDPTTGPAACNTITSMQVQGGTGDNTITGIDFSPAKFPLLPTDLGGGANGIYFHGGDGDDTLTTSTATLATNLFGDSGNDTLTGGNGNDYLDGDGPSCGVCPPEGPPAAPVAPVGNDALHGGGGTDSLQAYGGTDTLDGGPSWDNYNVFLGLTGLISLNDTGPPPAGPFDWMNSDTFNVIGTDSDDTITATNSQVSAGTLTMTFNGTIENHWIYGRNGNDSISAAAAAIRFNLNGENGNDTLTGGSGDDSLSDDAWMTATPGNDQLNGGGGVDNISSQGGTDTLDGQSGGDTYTFNVPRAFNATISDSGAAPTDAWTNIDRIWVAGSDGSDNLTLGASSIGGAGGSISFSGIDNIGAGGGPGNDQIDASAATVPVNIFGDIGNDTLVGSAQNDFVNGDGCNGSSCLPAPPNGDDSVSGGAGDDAVTSNGGTDALDGQGGNDSYDITFGATTHVSITDTGGPPSGCCAAGDQLSVHGTSGNDALNVVGAQVQLGTDNVSYAGVEALRVNGGAGDDTIDGSGAAPLAPPSSFAALFAFTGEDGNDTITGTPFNDWINGDTNLCCGPLPIAGHDILRGGDGRDTLVTSGGADDLDGQSGGDSINIDFNNPIGGTTINDSGTPGTPGMFENGDMIAFFGTPGADLMTLTPGQMTVASQTVTFSGMELTSAYGGDGNDTIDASTFTDPITNMFGEHGDDHLIGGSGNDSLTGDSFWYPGCSCPADGGNDTLEGNGGSDYLSVTSGTDSLLGGAAGDYYSAALTPGSHVTIPPDTGAPPTDSFDWQNIDSLFVSGTNASESFTVTEAAVTSATGENAAYGSGIEGLAVAGQAGNDTISAVGATRGVTLQGGGGNDQLTGGSGRDYIDDDDYDWCGGGPGCPPAPVGGNDVLNGGPGHDFITVNAGHDTVDGGANGDNVSVLLGAASAAIADTGAPSADPAEADNVNVVGGMGNDTIALTDTQATEGANTATYTGIELLSATGNTGDDVINASAATVPVSLYGDQGTDTITGGAGNDELDGGLGAGTTQGGAGDDILWTYDSHTSDNGQAGSDTYKVPFDYPAGPWTSTIADSGATGHDVLHWDCALPPPPPTVTPTNVTWNTSVVNYSGIDETPSCADIYALPGSSVDANVLNVNSDAANIVITCVALYVKVNGSDPDSGPATCASLTGIVVNGGASANTVDLSAVTPADFTGLNPPGGGPWNSQITVFGAGGNDHLIGSEFNDALYGGAGNDQLEGRGGDDQMTGDDSECALCPPAPPPGNDDLAGGAGNDNLVSRGGTDALDGQSAGDAYEVSRGTVNVTDSAPDSTGGDFLLTDTISIHGTDSADSITLTGAGATLHATRTGMNVTGLSTIEDITIFGGAGNDTINASTATVPPGHTLGIMGEDGSDTITGSPGPDTLNADDTCCSVPLYDGSDILKGGGGDDTLIANGGGTDALDGQAGNDSVEAYLGSGGLIKSYDASGASDTLAVWGSFEADTLTFTNVSATGAGGAGGSAAWGGMENVEGHGWEGNDTLTATARTLPIKLFGEAGDDTLNGGGVADELYGDWNGPAEPGFGPPGNDTINGNAGADTVNGGEGDDLLNGGTGADTMTGGMGADTVTYVGRGASVYASIGTGAVSGQLGENDSIDASVENLTGGSGGDILTGDANDNVLNGGAGTGADTLIGGAGADTMIGGAGIDTVMYSDHATDVTLTLGPGPDGAGGGAEGDAVGEDVENAIGGDGNDTLTGSDLANTISGGAGDDQIYGLAADDTLHGNVGNDLLDGGDGTDAMDGGLGADTFIGGGGSGDQVSYADHPSGVNASIGNGANDGSPAEGDDVQADIQALQGSPGNDTLTGGPNNDALYGNAGDDTLDGMGGNDSLFGNAGVDVLSGGEGNDKVDGGTEADGLNGGNGTDTASYSTRTSPVTVTLGAGAFDDGEAGEGDSVAADVENVTGGSGADTITGNANMNTLTGGGGNDTLNGGAGNDTLDGGLGADVLDGGAGADVATYALRAAGVTVTIGNGLADDGAPLEGDAVLATTESVLGGSGDDDITGNALANTLNGNAGADTLRGGGAIDMLSGGAGTDHLFARGDGLADKLSCGTEFDDGEADFLDVINADCESVVRA